MNKHDKWNVIRPVALSTGRVNAADQLRRLIESGHFAPGDRLPSERELVELLGMSRNVVRESMSTLEALGLIEIRHGSGSYVTNRPSQRNLSSIWSNWYRVHGHDLIYLLQVREALETKAAALAAMDRAPEVIDALEHNISLLRDAIASGRLESVAELDAAFHRAFVHASGNPILTDLLLSLDSVLENDRAAVYSLTDRAGRSLSDHQQIAAAIRERDPDMARGAIATHYASVVRDIQTATAADDVS